jgi:hypothetical protein
MASAPSRPSNFKLRHYPQPTAYDRCVTIPPLWFDVEKWGFSHSICHCSRSLANDPPCPDHFRRSHVWIRAADHSRLFADNTPRGR